MPTSNAHAHADEGLKGHRSVILQVLVPDNLPRLEYANDGASSELEVAKFCKSATTSSLEAGVLTITTFHGLSLHDRIHNGADHCLVSIDLV